MFMLGSGLVGGDEVRNHGDWVMNHLSLLPLVDISYLLMSAKDQRAKNGFCPQCPWITC